METVTIPVSTIKTIIDGLRHAYNVCDSVDYLSDDSEKSAPFAVGYSRASIGCAISTLKHIVD
jgi:hypothetical protein